MVQRCSGTKYTQQDDFLAAQDHVFLVHCVFMHFWSAGIKEEEKELRQLHLTHDLSETDLRLQ